VTREEGPGDARLFVAWDAYALMVASHLDPPDGSAPYQSDADYERACEFMRYGYPL